MKEEIRILLLVDGIIFIVNSLFLPNPLIILDLFLGFISLAAGLGMD